MILNDISLSETDCVVNAANTRLMNGSGVCGAIFRRAGVRELTEACMQIGHCNVGEAVITPGFNLKSKYIIHTVGPIYDEEDSRCPRLLRDCYRNSLDLVLKNNCKSVTFPLISTGIFGYPVDEALEIAIDTCTEFLQSHKDVDISVDLAVIDQEIYEKGVNLINNR